MMIINALISIKPCHVCSIKTGQKLVEIRNRKVHMPRGTCLWIYSTMPKGCIEVIATVGGVKSASPDAIWDAYGGYADIDYFRYKKYINGSSIATAIFLENVKVISAPITLGEIRTVSENFTPPQFYKKMAEEDVLLKFLFKKIPEFKAINGNALIGSCSGKNHAMHIL